MKSQKGITLISVTIYIIAMSVIIAIIAVISSYFYKNVDVSSTHINPLTEYIKFNSFFTDVANHSNIRVLECKQNYIVFDNGKQYTFVAKNKGVYENKVKICREVENCTFNHIIKNGKHIVEVKIKIGNEQEKSMQYTLRN